MFTSKIFPFICELEFGNPCNEAMNSVAFTFAIGLYAYEKLKEQEEDLTDKQKVAISLSIVASLTMIIMFCLQGIYNGTNTIDAVLFGVEIGIFIALVSHFYVRKSLDKHVTKVLDGLYVNRYRQAILGFTIAFLVLFMIITIEYVSVLAQFRPPTTWLYQISVKCPVSE